MLVEWGRQGQGQVSVVAGGGSGPNLPFQFFCGQQDLGSNPNNTSSKVYLTGVDGTAPYTVNYIINGGFYQGLDTLFFKLVCEQLPFLV
ncbi:MAG: hypothetical protein IPM82_21680 [Saprospiraceae bacterium]|nr:hypothetical protein [Saprospiraceae bacterium]